jgi:hypothetical protein
VRVLIAVDPFLYGEVLAFSLRKQRPRAEVTLLAPSGEHLLAAELERVCEQARPHLVVANRVPPAAKARSFWVEVAVSRGPKPLGAQIGAHGYSRSVGDARIADVLAALDRAEEELLAGGARPAAAPTASPRADDGSRPPDRRPHEVTEPGGLPAPPSPFSGSRARAGLCRRLRYARAH